MFRTCFFIWDTSFGTFLWFDNHLVARTKVTTRNKTFEAISECFRTSLYHLEIHLCGFLQSCAECLSHQHLPVSSRSKASQKFEQAMT